MKKLLERMMDDTGMSNKHYPGYSSKRRGDHNDFERPVNLYTILKHYYFSLLLTFAVLGTAKVRSKEKRNTPSIVP